MQAMDAPKNSPRGSSGGPCGQLPWRFRVVSGRHPIVASAATTADRIQHLRRTPQVQRVAAETSGVALKSGLCRHISVQVCCDFPVVLQSTVHIYIYTCLYIYIHTHILLYYIRLSIYLYIYIYTTEVSWLNENGPADIARVWFPASNAVLGAEATVTEVSFSSRLHVRVRQLSSG